MRAADGADQFLFRGHCQRWVYIMPVGTPVTGQPGKHQPQAVQQLCAGAEGTADARNARPLMKGQRRGNIQHLIHLGFGRLGHPAPGVGGQGFQIPAGALRIENPQSQGGFSGTGYPGDSHNFI